MSGGAIQPDASQQHAIELMLRARLALITGPPGSGKTTTLRFAVDRMHAAGERVVLAAPTGKAARRMEQLGVSASTIHRLLGYRGRGFFAVDEVIADAVIIDESSMIDYALATELLARCSRARLVLVGDANQLPPVGAGRMFGDLIDAEAAPVARLHTQHRAKLDSWVARNAPAVLTGGPIELGACPGFELIEVEKAGDIPGTVRELIAGLVGDRSSLRDREPPMVLCPQRPGPAGCEAVGAELDGVLNRVGPVAVHGEPRLGRGEHKLALRAGTRVIQTANDYELGVMNGELGWIVELSPGGGTVAVEFPDLDQTVVYSVQESVSLQQAYALTVHKTQGSQFEHVVCVVHSTHTRMLNRSLLYTAITRASKRVTIVGDGAGIERALRKDGARRASTLIDRIAGRLDPVIGAREVVV